MQRNRFCQEDRPPDLHKTQYGHAPEYPLPTWRAEYLVRRTGLLTYIRLSMDMRLDIRCRLGEQNILSGGQAS